MDACLLCMQVPSWPLPQAGRCLFNTWPCGGQLDPGSSCEWFEWILGSRSFPVWYLTGCNDQNLAMPIYVTESERKQQHARAKSVLYLSSFVWRRFCFWWWASLLTPCPPPPPFIFKGSCQCHVGCRVWFYFLICFCFVYVCVKAEWCRNCVELFVKFMFEFLLPLLWVHVWEMYENVYTLRSWLFGTNISWCKRAVVWRCRNTWMRSSELCLAIFLTISWIESMEE